MFDLGFSYYTETQAKKKNWLKTHLVYGDRAGDCGDVIREERQRDANFRIAEASEEREREREREREE